MDNILILKKKKKRLSEVPPFKMTLLDNGQKIHC